MLVRRRLPLTRLLALLLALSAGVYFGGRWLIWQYYPLPTEYRAILFRHAQKNGLDPYLVAAVIRTESRFRPDAVSAKGARGLMQIMPETGEWIAGQLKVRYHPDMLYDAEYNISLGCWYLATLHDEFGGHTARALAAYNGGRNNVHSWLDEKQWSGEQQTLTQIPFLETRLFVSRVLRDSELYRRIYSP
jgi:soluble lytic murein transglycosylase